MIKDEIGRMKKNTTAFVSRLNFNREDLLSFFVWASICLIFLAVYKNRFVLTNIDGVSYLSIARQYVDGHFNTAVNGYWSPIVSWLSAIFMLLGIESTFAFSLVNFFTSIAIIFCGFSIIKKVIPTRSYYPRLLYLFTVTPFLTINTTLHTPDMLVVLWVLSFLRFLLYLQLPIAKKYSKNYFIMAMFGLFGAVGYLIKLFLLPYFLSVTVLWFMLSYFAGPRKTSILSLHVRELSKVIFFFVVFASPWILLLSFKYGHFTLGSSFSVNNATRLTSSSVAREYFPDPPNNYAVSFMDDPTLFEKDSSTAPPVRKKGLEYYIRINELSPFILLTLQVSIFLALQNRVRIKKSYVSIIMITMSIVYLLGYWNASDASGGGGNTRYLWPAFFLTALAFITYMPYAYERVKSIKINRVLIIVLAIMLPFTSYLKYLGGYGFMFTIPISIAPLRVVETSKGRLYQPSLNTTYSQDYKLSEELQKYGVFGPGTKLTSNNIRQVVVLSFWMETQTFGSPGNGYSINDTHFMEIAKSFGVEYFIRFTPQREKIKKINNSTYKVVFATTYSLPCGDSRGAATEKCFVEVIKI